MDNQIILTLTEAIVKHKEDIQELQDLLELLQTETKANQDEVIKTKEVLEQRIDDLVISTQKMVDKVVSSGGGGINFNGLTELTTVLNTDYLVLLRNNLPYKVSVNTLKGVFGVQNC